MIHTSKVHAVCIPHLSILAKERWIAVKQCPKCNLNWIEDHAPCCSVCNEETNAQTPQTGNVGGIKHPHARFSEVFTFTNELAELRGKIGYLAYNANGENVGIVFEEDNQHTPAFECCTLCMYPTYYNRYGEWHRIRSHGGRIKWNKLCEILSCKEKCTYFID